MAERVFLKHGFSTTTMQMVASEAGASKETLYRHFGSKETLFAEVVETRSGNLRAHLDAAFESEAAIDAVLRSTGVNLLEAMGHPDILALLRIVVMETPHHPELGRVLYAIGPERTRRGLSDYLARARAAGSFRGDAPAAAATIFIGAVLANEPLLNLIRPPPAPMGRADIVAHVDAVVRMFLNTYGASGP